MSFSFVFVPSPELKFAMLNSSWSSSYKNLAKKAEVRECRVADRAISELAVDFRSRLFRYLRLSYANRTDYDRARSVFRAMKDLRLTGTIIAEKRRVYSAALAVIKREVSCLQDVTCTYVFPSKTTCSFKDRIKASNIAKTQERLEELKKRLTVYRQNMFDLDMLKHCALALESYLISDLDEISTMYSGREWILGVPNYCVPDAEDFYESDRMCARFARQGGVAVLSEDFDNVVLFGADMMIKEVYNNFFVYVSLRDVMEIFDSVSRKDALHKCCLIGTDYNLGLKGIGPVKIKKIDIAKAKELFLTCMSAQSIKPDKYYSFFML